MHPIERLRAVARARDVDQRVLAREAAMVLGALADDPLGLVTSCRRLLDRHPGAGVLWWACARLLDSATPRAEARKVVADLADEDAALRSLSLDLPEHSTVAVVPDAAGGSELADRLAVRRRDLVPVEAADPALDLAAVIDAGATLGAEAAGAGDGAGRGAGPPERPGPSGRQPGGTDARDAETGGLDAGLETGPGEAEAGGRPVPGTGPTIVVVEAGAAGPDRFLAVAGAGEGIATARDRRLPVWLVVGPGARLPGPLFEAAAARAPDCEVLPVSVTDRLVEPRSVPCPCPPELLR
ncbi:MAG TPA: hypothetical protein VIL48_22645 [Acidimicrobiales bacterium]